MSPGNFAHDHQDSCCFSSPFPSQKGNWNILYYQKKKWRSSLLFLFEIFLSFSLKDLKFFTSTGLACWGHGRIPFAGDGSMFEKNVSPLEFFPRKRQRKSFNGNIASSCNGKACSGLHWVFLSALPCGVTFSPTNYSSISNLVVWYAKKQRTWLPPAVGEQKVLMENPIT